MKRNILLALAGLSIGTLAFADTIVVCQNQAATITIDADSGTILRDGITYQTFQTLSFFGLVLSPVDPATGVADLDWGVRPGVESLSDIGSVGGVTLDLNGGTLHLILACSRQ